jgi:hypothetical protein
MRDIHMLVEKSLVPLISEEASIDYAFYIASGQENHGCQAYPWHCQHKEKYL